jgi:hypothetical protein
VFIQYTLKCVIQIEVIPGLLSNIQRSQFQCPCGLRSVAEHLLGSWVRIPRRGTDVCLLYSVCVVG